VLGAKNKADEYLMQFTQNKYHSRWGPVRRYRFQCKQPHLKNELLKKF